MIKLIRFQEFLAEAKAEVNQRLIENDPDFEGKIDSILISPTESHLIKNIDSKKGIVLAVKMADSDSEIESVDNFFENNHQLFFVLDKVDPGSETNDQEIAHYSILQTIMAELKAYIMERGLNGNVCGGDETLTKPFHTEWEYQVFGGFNGISTSFDLQDFEL